MWQAIRSLILGKVSPSITTPFPSSDELLLNVREHSSHQTLPSLSSMSGSLSLLLMN